MEAHAARASALSHGAQGVRTHATVVERRGSNHAEGEHIAPGGFKTGDLPPSGDLDDHETY